MKNPTFHISNPLPRPLIRLIALILPFFLLTPQLALAGPNAGTNTAPYIGGLGDGWYTLNGAALINNAAYSAAPQTFSVGQASTTMQPFTLYFGGGINVTAGVPLKLTIPASLAMTWDPTLTTATLTGTAASKFSTTVSYLNANQTLVLTCNTTTVDGDNLVISGLNYTNFTQSSNAPAALTVDTNNDGLAEFTDPNLIFVTRAAGPGNIYTGGLGQGWCLSTTGAFISPSLNSADNQLFSLGQTSTPIQPLIFYFGAGAQPNSSSGLRLMIPTNLAATWDTTISTITLGGTDASQFSTSVTYTPDAKTAILTVTGTVNSGDSLTISGLNLTNFTQISTTFAYLTADTNNDGLPELTDSNYKYIVRAAGAGSIFSGGTGDGWFWLSGGIYIGPHVTIGGGVNLRAGTNIR